MNSVLILGGYGNFGARITTALVKENIPVIIAGRNPDKAAALYRKLQNEGVATGLSMAIFDAHTELKKQLTTLQPAVVINTIGPFQSEDYSIPKICIQHNAHYIDLADARDFVTGITTLDSLAKEKKNLAVSG